MFTCLTLEHYIGCNNRSLSSEVRAVMVEKVDCSFPYFNILNLSNRIFLVDYRKVVAQKCEQWPAEVLLLDYMEAVALFSY